MRTVNSKRKCQALGVALMATVYGCASSPPAPPVVPSEADASVATRRAAEPMLRTRDDLAVAFDNHEWDLRAIFRDAKANNPEVDRGYFTLVVVIEPNGVVSGAQVVSSQFEGEPFLEAMRQAVLRWRFPAGNYARMQVSNSFELR